MNTEQEGTLVKISLLWRRATFKIKAVICDCFLALSEAEEFPIEKKHIDALITQLDNAAMITNYIAEKFSSDVNEPNEEKENAESEND